MECRLLSNHVSGVPCLCLPLFLVDLNLNLNLTASRPPPNLPSFRPSYNLARINELELAMLDALKFTIRVTAGEYAKYYFLLRSMIAKLGLHKEDPNYCKPLDVSGAKRLQLATERYDSITVQNITRVRRSVTMANLQRSLEMRSQSRDDMEQMGFRHQVGLEQLMHDEHNDADGRSRTLRKKEKDSGYLDGDLESGGGVAPPSTAADHK